MNAKKHATSCILLVLAAGTTGYLVLVDRGTPSDSERALRPHRVFRAFRAEEITRIELDRPGDPLIVAREELGQADGGAREWRIAEPADARGSADQAAVTALVSLLDSASPVRTASDDPSEFALPRAHGTIVMGKQRIQFDLGKTTSTPDGAAYFRVLGDASPAPRVSVVSADLARMLIVAADHFRARELVPNLGDRLERLAIDGFDRRVTWTRSGSVRYRLADGFRASRSALDRVELALADLRVESFVPVDLAARLTTPPTVSVTLQAGEAAPVSLRFGASCPGHLDNVVVLREASTTQPRLGGCVTRAALTALDVDPATLVETRVFQARADEVSELLLETPGAKLELARKGSGWHQRAPEDRDLTVGETEAAAALLDRMLAMRGTPHAAAGAPRAGARAGADHVATLRYGEPAEDDRFAFDDAGHGAEIDVTPEDARLLAPTRATLKPLAFWDPPFDRLHVDSIELRCDSRAQLVEETAAGWSLRRPVELPADGSLVIELVDAIAAERADRWLTSTVKADCTSGTAVSLHTKSGETACVEMVKGPNGESIVAVSRGGDAPSFAKPSPAAAEELRARACGLLVDRHRFLLAEDAETVTLRASGGKTRTLQVDALRDAASGGRADADAGAGTDPDVAVIATLDSLVADDVAHLGAPEPADALARPALTVVVRFDGKRDASTSAASQTWRFGGEIATSKGLVRRAAVDGLAAVFTFSSAKLAPLFAGHDASGDAKP